MYSFKVLSYFQLSKPKISGVAREGSLYNLQDLDQYPVYFQWEGSRVGQVYLVSGDAAWSQNVKLGIVSLLQLQRESGTRTEVSVVTLTKYRILFNTFNLTGSSGRRIIGIQASLAMQP